MILQLNAGEYLGGTAWERSLGGVRLTLSVYRAGDILPWHRHTQSTFFFLLSGSHRDLTRQGGFDQPPYTFVYHPAAIEHSAEFGHRPVYGLNVAYEPDWLERQGFQESKKGLVQALDSSAARWAGIRLLALAFHPGERVETDLELQVMELLAAVSSGTRSEALGAACWMRAGEDYLHEHFRDPITLRDVAREAGVHPVYFARVFRRRHRCTVGDYLRRLRLTEAGRLVLQGMPLVHAAYAAGFADQSHFCRCFSTAVGFSPKGLLPARRALPA